MEEEACPGQENPLPEVHRNCQALAQDLRVWTGEAGPEGESIPKGQNEKNDTLDSISTAEGCGYSLSCLEYGFLGKDIGT